MDDTPLPFVSGSSTDVDRLVPIHCSWKLLYAKFLLNFQEEESPTGG